MNPFKKDLPSTCVIANNINPLDSKPSGLTENCNTQCHALNMAFFVPKIHQAWCLLKNIKLGLSSKTNAHILNMDGLKHGIKDPSLGNTCKRVTAFSNTRPPVSKTGGLTKNCNGGLPMPSNTPKSAVIRTIQASHTPNGIKATIHTRYHQKAVIGRFFVSIHQLKQFMQDQGLNPLLVNGEAV